MSVSAGQHRPCRRGRSAPCRPRRQASRTREHVGQHGAQVRLLVGGRRVAQRGVRRLVAHRRAGVDQRSARPRPGSPRAAPRPRGTASRRGRASRRCRARRATRLTGDGGRRAAAAGGRRAGAGPPARPRSRRPAARRSRPRRRAPGKPRTSWPARRLGERRLDGAEHPVGLAGAGEPAVGGDLGHRLGELRPQRLLERLEVLAAGLLAAAVVDDPVGRAQVLGHLGPVPRLARHDDAGAWSGSSARARRAAAPPRPAPRRGTRGPCWGPARS